MQIADIYVLCLELHDVCCVVLFKISNLYAHIKEEQGGKSSDYLSPHFNSKVKIKGASYGKL